MKTQYDEERIPATWRMVEKLAANGEHRAATYIAHCMVRYISGGYEAGYFAPSDTLGGLFVWKDTPQGNEFWCALADKYDMWEREDDSHDADEHEEFEVGDKVRYTGEFEEAWGDEYFDKDIVYTVKRVDTKNLLMSQHEGTTRTIVVSDGLRDLVYMMEKNFKRA